MSYHSGDERLSLILGPAMRPQGGVSLSHLYCLHAIKAAALLAPGQE